LLAAVLAGIALAIGRPLIAWLLGRVGVWFLRWSRKHDTPAQAGPRGDDDTSESDPEGGRDDSGGTDGERADLPIEVYTRVVSRDRARRPAGHHPYSRTGSGRDAWQPSPSPRSPRCRDSREQ
jgi:hypothetical protein